MARVDDDDRPVIGEFRVGGLRLRLMCRLARHVRRPVVERDGAHESLAIDLGEFEHQARRLAVVGIEHKGLLDAGRPRQVDDDARAARHDESVAERLDQAATLLPGFGRELECDLRHVDDDAKRVGKGKGADVDLLAQIEHQPALRLVTAEPHVARDRKVIGGAGLRPGSTCRLAAAGGPDEQRTDDECQTCRAEKHRTEPLRASDTPCRGNG